MNNIFVNNNGAEEVKMVEEIKEPIEVGTNVSEENKESEEEKSVYQDTLDNMIDMALKFQKGEIQQDQLSEYFSRLTIRSYLPILVKTKVVSLILLKLFADPVYTLELKMAKLYMDMFFYGLIQEYCFIDCSNTELITFDNYDLLYSVFGDRILENCKQDYDMFNHFFWDNMALYNIQEIGGALEKIDVNALKQDTLANKRILDEFSKNTVLIKSLNDIAMLLDPNVTDVAEIMKRNAAQTAKEGKNKTKK